MKFLWLSLLVAFLFLLNLFIGSVYIPFGEVWKILGGEGGEVEKFIIIGNRLPSAVTALFAGSGLAVAGLLLQTAFRNPLAGPSILGITSGASLGVAVVMLFLGGTLSAGSLSVGDYTAVIIAAFVGSLAVMGLLIFLSSILRNELMLLITGIMIGYIVSSVITLLNSASTSESIRGYVYWGMGSFNGVALNQLPLFCLITLLGLFLAFLLMKPLDLLLLGQSYARNLGVNLTGVRNLLLLSTGILTAVITAYCGPISFLGLAVPHIARLFFPTDNHRILLPATCLTGAAIALGCLIICVLPSSSIIPLNAVTPLIGAPVVIWVIFKRRGK